MENKIIKLEIKDSGEFVPVADDHWFTDLLKNAKINKNVSCLCGFIILDDKEKE